MCIERLVLAVLFSSTVFVMGAPASPVAAAGVVREAVAGNLAEEATVLPWNHGDTWGSYTNQLQGAGWQPAPVDGADDDATGDTTLENTFAAVNRDNIVTTPVASDLIEGVEARPPSGPPQVIAPGQTVVVPAGTVLIIKVARVPFPPDSHADRPVIPDLFAYLYSMGLAMGALYQGEGPPPVLADPTIPPELLRGIKFYWPTSPRPNDLSVGTAVGVIVTALEPGSTKKPGDESGALKELVALQQQTIAAQEKAIAALAAALQARGGQGGGNPSSGPESAPSVSPEDAATKSEFKILEGEIKKIYDILTKLAERIKVLEDADSSPAVVSAPPPPPGRSRTRPHVAF
jgi:hypothetical protein